MINSLIICCFYEILSGLQNQGRWDGLDIESTYLGEGI